MKPNALLLCVNS